MAILKGIVSNLSGSAGNLTFRRNSGATIVSEKVTDVKSSRTEPQQRHRTKWANIVAMYRGLSPLLEGAFQRKTNRRSDYNMFMKVNMQQTPVYLTKSQVAGGACVAAPYVLTQGTLPAIVTTGSGSNAVTDIALGSLDLTASTTVAQFAKAVVANNEEYKEKDQISFFTISQKVNESTGIPYCTFKAYAVVLNYGDDSKLWDVVDKVGFTSNGGKLGHGSVAEDCVYAWVHSRKGTNNVLVSSQSLIDNNSKLADYTSDEAYTAAAASYGTTTSVFLNPNSDNSTTTSTTDSTDSSSSSGGSL